MTDAKNEADGGASALEYGVMPRDAFALRPVRFMRGDSLRYYSGTTFPKGPRQGCDLYYRRCAVFGGVSETEDRAAGICDVLNAEGDIVGDFFLTRKGLRYLYREFDLRVEGA